MTVSYKELRFKCEADVHTSRQETELLQQELNKEFMIHEEMEMKSKQLIQNLRDELDVFHQQTEQEKTFRHQTQLPEETLLETGDILNPESIQDSQVLKETLPETRNNDPSLFKRIRHSLSLRKPKN